MTDLQKTLQIEISHIVDNISNGLTHPMTAKKMLYESNMKALKLTSVSKSLPVLDRCGCPKPEIESILICTNCNGYVE